MFKEIFRFEWAQQIRRWNTWLYAALLLAIPLLIVLAAIGVFSETRSDTNVFINSMYSISSIYLSFFNGIIGLLGSIILISIVAVAIQKDYQYNMHALFFTKPLSKAGYFWGRFGAAICIAILVFFMVVIGFYVGTLYGKGSNKIGPYHAVNYLLPFIYFILPNLLLFGIIFFSLATYFRNTMPTYIVAISIMILQMVASTLGQKIEYKEIAALVEPSGSNALRYVTQYWSADEKNHLSIPLEGYLLYNRLLWFGIAILITFVSYNGFSFSQFLNPLSLFKKKAIKEEAPIADVQSLQDLPVVQQRYDWKAQWRQIKFMASLHFKKMLRSPFFITMALLGIGLMILVSSVMDMMYDTPTQMVTYKITGEVVGSILLFNIIFTIFYSGTLVWRDRETRMDELVGVTPVSNAALFFSKWLALLGANVVLLLIAAICGIFIQIYHQFYQIDIWQYVIFLITGIVSASLMVAVCVAAHVYSPNKYLGFFLCMIPLFLLSALFGWLNIDSTWVEFNSTGYSDPYSDMNGYGGNFIQYPFFKSYWIAITGILTMLAIAVYGRGKEKSILKRFKLSAFGIRTWHKILMGAFALIAVGMGSYIYYQNKVVVKTEKNKEIIQKLVSREKKYKRYQKLTQPRIVASSVQVDIFPSTRLLNINGSYTLKNIYAKQVDTLFLNYIGGLNNNYEYSFDIPNSKLIENDVYNGIRLVVLDKPLLPGDSMDMKYSVTYKPKSFFHKVNSPVVTNGTFLHSSSYLPLLGYNDSKELSENEERKRHGLPFKPGMNAITDTAGLWNNYISNDADFIRFDATISTDEDQIAIAPGYLQKEWKQNGRRYFQYKMDAPILNFYSFLSARYEVKREKWNDVNLEIYYHKGHEFNLDRMMNSMKKSLAYYTANFSPYQHRQLRIIEFPRYAPFAQSFPNTIPYSEAIGFIAKVPNKPNAIDVPFYVTAHEVAHQWWAHQVIGANVQGSVVMSETMSQYAALMVMEKEYGKYAMRKFLEHEMDKYLRGRTFDGKGELPLMLVESQSYIYYNKGSLVMYALKDFLGEDTLNVAIRNYLNQYKFKGPLYSTAINFVDEIDKVTPDSLKYLITDMFEKITIYENYIKSLKSEKQSDGKYKVTLTVGSAKFHADSTGKLKTATVKDYMDIGIFAKQSDKAKRLDKPLLLQRIKMDAAEKTFVFVVSEEPGTAGLDPFLKLIDRTPKNNTANFGDTPPKVNLSADAPPAINIKLGDD